MAESGDRSPRKVGVYDRPASADRPSRLPMIVAIVIAAVGILLAYFYFTR